MSEKKSREIAIGAFFGIVGVVVGAVMTGLMNAYVQEKQQRTQAVMNSFTYEQGNFPIEYHHLKQLVEEVRNLSIMSSASLSKLAKIVRKYPDCTNTLEDRCRPAVVETIQVYRDELGSGTVAAEDIDTVLSGKYQAAQRAIQRVQRSQK